MKFGIAFNEASGPRLVRRSGNDDELIDVAVRNAQAIGAGHLFVVALRDGFPINVLNAVKAVPEVCRVFCATANPLEVVVGETEQGRGVLGVIDGSPPAGVETDEDEAERKAAAAPLRLQAVSEIPLPPELADQLREAHETYRQLVEGIPASCTSTPTTTTPRTSTRARRSNAPRFHRRAVARRPRVVDRSHARGRP